MTGAVEGASSREGVNPKPFSVSCVRGFTRAGGFRAFQAVSCSPSPLLAMELLSGVTAVSGR